MDPNLNIYSFIRASMILVLKGFTYYEFDIGVVHL